MLNAHEQRLIAFYLSNAAARFHYRDPEATELVDWLACRENRLVFRDRRRRQADWEARPGEGLTARRWRSVQDMLRSELEALKGTRPDRTAQRLRRLGKTVGLTPTDVDILELLLRYQTQPVIEGMIEDIFPLTRRIGALNLKGSALAVLLGKSAHTAQSRFGSDKPLLRSGLVSIDRDGDPTVARRLHRLATVPATDRRDVNQLLLDAAPGSELDWQDFDHVAEDRNHLESVLKGALASGEPGVNILLYGPPGTGKTEFCKVLARRLGLTLYSVGEADEEGDEPTRDERLRELRLAQRLLAGERRSLILFDEMEDLLSDFSWGLSLFGRSFGSGSRGSKVYLHRLLEEAPAPTLWTMNDARQVNPAVLRRFMFALEMRPLTPAVRQRIWARQLGMNGIEAGIDEARGLAVTFEATPGVAAGVTTAARLAGGGIGAVHRGVHSLSRLLGCDKPPQATPQRFDLSLVRADIDPAVLADRLASSRERHFSLCLLGAPGTGKSALTRYLAERLGLEVVQKRASDLLSKYVGDTEKHIAEAFAEARASGAFLVFDEADSLLADRRLAERNWEVSQVNEMLTWMESHPLPFACTTNLADHLDPATLRRFVFKITLDYLAPEQAAAAFRRYFGLAAPAPVAALATLTPGDFSVVRRKAEVLGQLEDPQALAAMLRAECDAKREGTGDIGFRAALA